MTTAGDKSELQPDVSTRGRATKPRTLRLLRVLATQNMAHALTASILFSPIA
jgi:hypothetical protein